MVTLSRREAIITATIGSLWLKDVRAASASVISDGGFVRIGGIDQWVAIQGKNLDAPVALFLHGGPGEAMSPFQDIFSPYEQDFTWAIWDQRGSGKTFGRNGEKTPGMELEQFIQDTIELAAYLCKRYSKRKIVLVGQSWGSALGLQVAQRRPDLFHAFVGTGQSVSNELGLVSQERYARKVMTERNDEAGLTALAEASRLPATDPKRRFAVRKFLFGSEDNTFLAREMAYTGPQPFPTTGEIADWIAGYTFTSNVLVPKIIGKEVIDIVGLDIPLPFFVIQGKDDLITPTDVAREYFEKVKAPVKVFAEVRGGHFCFYTDQEECLAPLRQHVLPLAR